MIAEVHFSGAEHQGKRAYQEDYYAFFPFQLPDRTDALLVVLADGMGGHQSGDIASRLAVDSFIETFDSSEGTLLERLFKSLLSSNASIRELIESTPDPSHLLGMGTTLVGAVITKNALSYISVGDSPLYKWSQNQLVRINEDHSMASILEKRVHLREISSEEAKSHPDRNSLRAALTGDQLNLVDYSKKEIELQSGNLILLASDGISTVDEQTIHSVIAGRRNSSVTEIVAALISEVVGFGKPNQDNLTIALLNPFGTDPEKQS